jgi:hypothetical protein
MKTVGLFALAFGAACVTSAGAQAPLDRTVLPIPEPKPPRYTELDEVGCIHPKLGEVEELKRCYCLVGYLPSDLSVPHNRIMCTLFGILAPK